MKDNAQADNSNKKNYRILIMDDNIHIQRTLLRLLSHLGYTAEATSNGSEALMKYKKEHNNGRPFDLLIMDLLIPDGMGGAEAIFKIRQFDKNAKAIVSSTLYSSHILENHKAHGFCGTLLKPYGITELKEALKKALGNHKEEAK
jgi:CheY-like chemotaxis protein